MEMSNKISRSRLPLEKDMELHGPASSTQHVMDPSGWLETNAFRMLMLLIGTGVPHSVHCTVCLGCGGRHERCTDHNAHAASEIYLFGMRVRMPAGGGSLLSIAQAGRAAVHAHHAAFEDAHEWESAGHNMALISS